MILSGTDISLVISGYSLSSSSIRLSLPGLVLSLLRHIPNLPIRFLAYLFSLVKDETLLAYQKSVVKRKRGRIGLSELRMYVYDRGLSYVCDIKNRMDCSEPTEVGARNQP